MTYLNFLKKLKFNEIYLKRIGLLNKLQLVSYFTGDHGMKEVL